MLQRTSSSQSQNLPQDPQPTGPIGDGLDLRGLWQIARRRGPMVAALTLLVTVIAVIYAMQLTPVYTATATLLIDPPKVDSAGSEAVFNRSAVDDGIISSQLALIKTSAIAERVANRLKLGELDSWFVSNPSLVKQLTRAIFKREAVPNPIVDADQTAQ